MKPLKTIILTAFLLLFSGSLLANNIQITKSPEIVNRDIPGNKVAVRFSLSWDNSWNLNSPANRDAAWVFMKYRVHGSDGFKHCNLHQAPDVVKGAGSDVCFLEYGESPVPNRHPATTGVFLSRAYKSVGTTTFNDVELVWDITELGIDSNTVVSVGVYAIEMVYVPVGEVLSSNTVAADVNAKWPNGSSPFYIMKHEVTQAAWVDFLNTLDYQQQSRLANISLAAAAGTPIPPANSRMMIKVREPSPKGSKPAVFGVSLNGTNWDIETNGGNIPMFNLAWTDVTAYLDWACLRPLTEMEYEKAARGNLPVVANELAWGNATLGTAVATISNTYRSDEISGTAGANRATPADANVNAHSAAVASRWPLRAGCFATDVSTRQEAGVGYWGVLNLSDNVLERYVNYSQATGKLFSGAYHGDGNLLGSGLSNVETWPGQASALGAATGADGTGYKGLGIAEAASTTVVAFVAASAGVSARTHINNRNNSREGWTGARGGRTIFIPFVVLAQPAVTRRASTVEGIAGGTGTAFPALSVKGVGGTAPYTYQWYMNETMDTLGAEIVAGAINSSYTPSRNVAHTEHYYFCVMKDVEGAVIVTQMSGAHTVLGIEKQPSATAVTTTIDNIGDLTNLEAVPAGGAKPYSFQWYINTAANNSNGTQIAGANSQSYFPELPLTNMSYYFWCLITDNRGQSVRTNVSGVHRYQPAVYSSTGVPQNITLASGKYMIECWGAQGGAGRAGNTMSYSYAGGKGAYTKGIITLTNPTDIYLYIGLVGQRAPRETGGAGGWNGGGLGGWDMDGFTGTGYKESGGGGGGASDVRLVSGDWDDVTSLRSRIMVAAGGGGSASSASGYHLGCAAGTLNGIGNARNTAPTQTTGKFGFGGPGFVETTSRNYGGGGGHGSGYYGGYIAVVATDIAGTGGSSFISGHAGCNAVDAFGTHTGQPNHFSGKTFTNTDMRAGNAALPNPVGAGNATITGNTGNGYVRISKIK